MRQKIIISAFVISLVALIIDSTSGFSQFFAWIKALFLYGTKSSLNSSFLSDVAAVEAVLIGISVPISLHVVTWTADRYRDHEIAKLFVGERLYRLQFFLLFPNIVIAILFRLIDTVNPYLLWFIFLWLIFNLFVFYKFIKIVEQYATNSDQYLLGRLKHYVQTILQK